MSLIIRKVRNETAYAFSLFVPGEGAPGSIVLAPTVTVDLLASVSTQQLEEMQININQMIASGALSSQGTLDTAAIESARTQSLIVASDAPVAAVSYTQVDIQTIVTLLNALKATVNAMNS